MRLEQATGTVGYLLRTYPKVSETFILHEILTLEQRGVPLHIFALQPPQEQTVQALTSQVQARVTYVPVPRSGQYRPFLHAHWGMSFRQPIRYGRTVRFVSRRQEEPRFAEFLQAGYVAWAMRRAGIGHLHAHYATDPAGVAELVHRLSGLPYSITAHAKDIYLSPPAVLRRKMQRARFVVTCTEYNRRHLRDIGVGTTPLYRIYHGVDVQRFQPDIAAESTASAALPVILSVGRLREKKGFLTLLRACDHLYRKGYRFCCQIVGYGPLQAEMEKLIATLGLQHTVTLHGRMTQDELLGFYRHAQVFVLPCQVAADGDRDGIPNVLVEAMAMQLPVVSTPVSGIPELVEHRRDGLLVPPREPEALAAALGLLLDQPRLRQTLGQAGRRKVCAHFSLAHNTGQMRALLTKTRDGG